MRSNEKPCVCNVFATPHSKNPVKSSVPSYLNIKFSWGRTCKLSGKIHYEYEKTWELWISYIEVNKISGYILATKTLRTNRIIRITNHKTHKNRTYNTLYKHLHECKRRVWIIHTIIRYQYLCGLQANLLSDWQQNGNILWLFKR